MTRRPETTNRRIGNDADELTLPLRQCARGEVPANIAVLKLAIAASHASQVDDALARAIDHARSLALPEMEVGRLEQALVLWRDNPQAFETIKKVLADLEHDGIASSVQGGITHWASTFDRIARVSPEGSVALYALGNPDLLRVATAEVVERLRTWALIGPMSSVLDLGCGIGRFAEALAPEVRRVIGLDISGVMVERARERCAHLSNVTIGVSSGHDLSLVGTQEIDLVLAADVFPYLVQAGASLIERHLRESARVLKPGGVLLILNHSYRQDADQDRDDLARLAPECGLELVRVGSKDFSHWDATTFQLSKPV